MIHSIRRHLPLLLMTALLAACSRDSSSEKAPATSTPGTTASEPAPTEPRGPIRAVVRTIRGDFTIELRPEEAPISCANFVNLVQRGFYDGLPFYRHSTVIRQVGNPHGDETIRWQPGYRIAPEFSPDLKFDRPGMVGMVRVTDDVRAPVRPHEFFVTTKPQSERFTFVYPIFAEVVEGQSVVNSLKKDETIVRIEIEGDPSPLLADHADLIAQWNRQLDATPDPRG